MPIIGEEGKGGTCGKATKGTPIEGASAPYKGKSAGRRKKVKESKGERGSACGQAMRSTARVEEELSRKAKKKSRGTLWKRHPRRGAIIRTKMVYEGSSSVIPNL